MQRSCYKNERQTNKRQQIEHKFESQKLDKHLNQRKTQLHSGFRAN